MDSIIRKVNRQKSWNNNNSAVALEVQNIGRMNIISAVYLIMP